jgi:hypothetical protein
LGRMAGCNLVGRAAPSGRMPMYAKSGKVVEPHAHA